MKMPIKGEDPVTWKGLAGIMVASLGVVSLLVGGAVARADASASKAEQAAKAAVASLEVKVDSNKRESDAGNAEVRKDIQAVYNFLLTRQRQERLEKPK